MKKFRFRLQPLLRLRKQQEDQKKRVVGALLTQINDLQKQALELKHQSQKLAERVRERTAELHDANMEAIYMLAVASEAKDTDTGAHVLRIKQYTRALALPNDIDLPPPQFLDKVQCQQVVRPDRTYEPHARPLEPTRHQIEHLAQRVYGIHRPQRCLATVDLAGESACQQHG